MFLHGFTKLSMSLAPLKNIFGRTVSKAVQSAPKPALTLGGSAAGKGLGGSEAVKHIAAQSNVRAARLERGLAKSQARVAPKKSAPVAVPAKAAVAPSSDASKDYLGKAKEWVKKNPLKSTAAGGLAAGYMMGSGSNDNQYRG